MEVSKETASPWLCINLRLRELKASDLLTSNISFIEALDVYMLTFSP